jgi:ribosomal protein S18 acetylase RimI-like enzyme
MASVSFSQDINITLRRVLLKLLKQRRSLVNSQSKVSTKKQLKLQITMGASTPKPASISEKQQFKLGAESTPAVRICTLSEYKAIAHTLALSFADDPVALHFINLEDTKHWSATRKWNLHVAIMEALVYSHIMCGIVTTSGPDYEAVALWLPPNTGDKFDAFTTQFFSGMWSLRWKLSPMGRARFYDEFMPLLHSVKHSVLGDRDNQEYYLVYLGTKPQARRMGYARALLEDGITRAEQVGAPCYLESSKAINVGIYEKFGFQVRDRIELETEDKGRTVPLDIMVRDPTGSYEILNEKI